MLQNNQSNKQKMLYRKNKISYLISKEKNLSVSNVHSILWRDTFRNMKIPDDLEQKLFNEMTKRCKSQRRKEDGSVDLEWVE
jgi:hypothetical protein